MLQLLLPLLLPVTLVGQAAPRIETSGLDHFWRLQEMLAQGREPSDSAWDALWATPGYATLEQRERRRAQLTMAMRLALNPARSAAADSAMAGHRWLAMVIPHLRQVAARRDTLRRVERSLGAPETFRAAMAKAQEFLPEGTIARLPIPEVSLIYFLDARGYDRILFDPSYLMDLHDPALVLGHELHHYYGNQLARPARPFGEDMIAWRLATTETEGVAGLVDKRDVPGLSRAELAARYRDPRSLTYFENYQQDYQRSNQWLAWVDDILRRSLSSRDSTLLLGRVLDAGLPDNGRIMGAFMAEVILEQLGHGRLMACVANPWCFWRTYNDAARRTGGKAFVLSVSAMTAVDLVEARYTASAAAGRDSLFATIAALDSAMFSAYNRCDLPRLETFLADDLEFYHDQTGLMRSPRAVVEAVRQNICGKVRRDPVAGTLEVYPLRTYGAVATGLHRFCDARRFSTCDQAGGPARFVTLWQFDAGRWKIARVISYDHH